LATGASAGEPEFPDSTLNQFTEYKVAASRKPWRLPSSGFDDQDGCAGEAASCSMRWPGCLSPWVWTRGAELAREDESRVEKASFSAFSPYGKKRMRELGEERARRTASRLVGGGNGGEGGARRGPERERRWE
jgi:hypothetical protein